MNETWRIVHARVGPAGNPTKWLFINLRAIACIEPVPEFGGYLLHGPQCQYFIATADIKAVGAFIDVELGGPYPDP